jgi:hypothetical protein
MRGPGMGFRPGMGRFGDASSGQVAPVQAPPVGQDVMDFFDPETDGSDVMYYATNAQGLASTNTGVNTTIQIDSGVDFYWLASTYQADLAGAAQTESGLVVPLVNVLINDTGSRKNLQNIAIPVSSIAGFGERPYRLIRPRLFRASSTINFTWTSIVTAGTTYTNLYFVMHGYVRPKGA